MTEDTTQATQEAPAEPKARRSTRTAAAAPESAAPAPAAPAPCADCSEREATLEERLERLESAHRALAKGFVTAVAAALVVYMLSGIPRGEAKAE
jgi:hypothetical protein